MLLLKFGSPHFIVREQNNPYSQNATIAYSSSNFSKDSSSLDTCFQAYYSISHTAVVSLYKDTAPDAFIVQNPPSVPTLVVVKWASWLRHSAFIVNWHNFGYTILALSLGRSSYFVAVYRWMEKHFGKMAHGSLCVTRAMQHELDQNWRIKATVLYDQPLEFFRPALLEERHDLFCRISKSLNQPYGLRDCIISGSAGPDSNYLNITPFTTQIDSDISLKGNRPALIVSSTSWTPDEDFSILLEAAVMYDRSVAALLHEDDSIEDETVWEEIHSGKRFAYPRGPNQNPL